MNPPVAGPVKGGIPAPQRTSAATKTGWRIIPAFDADPQIVAYAQTLPGRLILLAMVTALSICSRSAGVGLEVAPLATLCAWTGSYRRYLIPIATLCLLGANGFYVDTGVIQHIIAQEGLSRSLDAVWLVRGSILAFVLASSGLMAMWPRISTSVPIRPTLGLILTFLALVVLAQSPLSGGTARAVLWSLVLVFQPFLWFLAYALSDLRPSKHRPVWQHLGVFHPFWGSTSTPFGKGLAYLERYESKTPEDVAVTQLKGLKLAIWILLLTVCLSSISYVVHGGLRLPSFDETFLNFVAGTPDSRFDGWVSLGVFFLEDVMQISVWGGAIVACARLAGFRLLRNTYRPLEAKTLADFWNRYYFYYKELLVDHFFYPVFMRCFRKNRRLRIFFATFMAACVGNLLFHFMRDIHFVAEMGWRNALAGEASHAFYTFLLATGVGVSQMRSDSRKRPKGWVGARLVPYLWVAFFFCILHVFDAPLDRVHSIGQRAHFLSYLLGIDAWI